MSLPFSQACENNKQPIAEILSEQLQSARSVFEVGSGSGQHAEYFASLMPHLDWQASERADNLAGLKARIDSAALSNLPAPVLFDVDRQSLPGQVYDAVFSANTLHIMRWASVQRFFALLPRLLSAEGSLFIYGPFNYAGQFTSHSNALFDQSLKSRDPLMGIRDIEQVQQLAQQHGFSYLRDYQMPANNRLLHFSR